MSFSEDRPRNRDKKIEEGITTEDNKVSKNMCNENKKTPTEGEEWIGRSRFRTRWIIGLITANIILFALLFTGLLLWYLQVIPERTTAYFSPAFDRRECTSLGISMCYKYKVPYSYTLYPNSLGHKNHLDASDSISKYEPIVSVKCSPLLPLFLCSLYAPKCKGQSRTVPPCKSFCKDTVRKCEFFLGVFTVMWPENMDCDSYPESSDPDVCIGQQEMKYLERRAQACSGGFRCDRTRCLPNSWVCDGFFDCKDASDERNCSYCVPHQYYCGNGECIDKDLVCDGVKHCSDGREERKCLRLSNVQGDYGEGLLEAYSLTSDSWKPVCGDNWDTSTMSRRACSMLGYKSANETRLKDEALPPENRVAVGVVLDDKKHTKSIFDRTHAGCEEDNVFVYLKCQNFDCGKSASSGGKATPRIVGGNESDPGTWPWLVALHGGPDEVFFCGGVLISEWWVLSAAHCVGNQTDMTGYTLKLGMTRRTSYHRFVEKRGVSDIIQHDEFSPISLYTNDIVMLRLDSPVKYDDYLRPICLPPEGFSEANLRSCTVIGWGKQLHHDEADYQTVVHHVEVPIVDFDTCSKWYKKQDMVISETMLCAGFAEGKKDACQGDSGGPLICKAQDDSWFVAGVVSWGIKCAQPNLPGIYTNVLLYVKWIKDIARESGFPIEF